MSRCMTPAGVKYLTLCMTPAGVKYVMMYDSCRSQVCQYVWILQESSISMYDSCRSQVSPCMTLAGVNNLHV